MNKRSESRIKRALPRFSLRLLLFLTLLFAAYFSCAGSTKRRGIDDVADLRERQVGVRLTPEYVAPLFLKLTTFGFEASPTGGHFTCNTRYYVWFFGFVGHVRETDSIIKSEDAYEQWGVDPAIEPPPKIYSR